MRWALLILLLKLIAIVALWIGAAIWVKVAIIPATSADLQALQRVPTVVTIGLFSILITILDRNNVREVMRTSLIVGLCAALGVLFAIGNLEAAGVWCGIAGALVGVGLTQWKFRVKGLEQPD